MKLEIEKYQRLFSHPGLRLLLNEIAMLGYKGLGLVSIVKDDDFVCYMPKEKIEETSAEGLILYGSEQNFDKYVEDFRKFQREFTALCSSILKSKDISKDQIKEFIKHSERCINFYRRTEFIYVDKPYLESKKGHYPELDENLKKYEKIKFEFRDYINTVYLGTNSFYLKILDKLSSKFNVGVEDLQQYKIKEILDLFENKTVSKDLAKERFHRNIIIDKNGDFEIYWGNEADELIKNFIGSESSNEEIKGTVVHRGKIKGKVVIIKPAWNEDFSRIKSAMEKMNSGDILVSETTSPDIMPAIKKAGAIVTDQGGLMSHAAIMSRELKVPGIVGTGNATKILKDGDMVEVDADNGIVKILNK